MKPFAKAHEIAARFTARLGKVPPLFAKKAESTRGSLYLYDVIGADYYGGISAQMVVDADYQRTELRASVRDDSLTPRIDSREYYAPAQTADDYAREVIREREAYESDCKREPVSRAVYAPFMVGNEFAD